jgi:hypothetical protein
MAYFYFDFRDIQKQNCRNLVSSLIQLSARSPPCYDIISSLYLRHDKGRQEPNANVLIECLKEMLRILHHYPTYIILDALDECPISPGIPPREQVLTLVKEFVVLPNLRLCVTSRPEVDIRAALEPLGPHRVSLHEQSGQMKDIVDYVNSVIYSDADTNMKKWRDDVKKSVVETLSEQAYGM